MFFLREKHIVSTQDSLLGFLNTYIQDGKKDEIPFKDSYKVHYCQLGTFQRLLLEIVPQLQGNEPTDKGYLDSNKAIMAFLGTDLHSNAEDNFHNSLQESRGWRSFSWH